ncbi:MAG: hypothetical protein RR346_05920 [Bacteroidales bacterium]
MKKMNYNIKEVSSLKEIRYEKARIVIEMAYIEKKIHTQAEDFLHGGFLQSVGLGWNMFASAGKWLLIFKAAMKGWKWIQHFLKKKKV